MARQCLQTTTAEERGEQMRKQTEVLLLTSLTVITDHFYIALFSALEQIHCARM